MKSMSEADEFNLDHWWFVIPTDGPEGASPGKATWMMIGSWLNFCVR
jgi:hypothetical protein